LKQRGQSMREAPVSLNEREFILAALSENLRADGRGPFEYRELSLSFGRQSGHVEARLGDSRVLAVVSCKAVPPRESRPTEGYFHFKTQLSPMAAPEFEAGRPHPLQVEVGRVVERGLRESRAIDTEALCIVAGELVWEVRCDIHVLDHSGNLIDCASIAVITALMHFRRPDVTVVGTEYTIHSLSERQPVPLSIHHMPVAISFAFLDEGRLLVVDPSLQEENCMDGRVSITLNADGELCAVKKSGGVAIGVEQLLECTKIAGVKATEITKYIRDRLEKPDEERASHKPTAFSALPKEITVTYGDDVEMDDGDGDGSDEGEAEETVEQSQRQEEKEESAMAAEEDIDMGEREAAAEEDTVMEEAAGGGEGLFSGGVSQWGDEEEDEKEKEEEAPVQGKRDWGEDNDSEEEETVVMVGTEGETAPAPAAAATEEEEAPKKKKKKKAKKKAGDLSAAVKKKKTKKKKAGDLSAAVKTKKPKK